MATTKDYINVAAALRASTVAAFYDSELEIKPAERQHRRCCERVAEAFARDNPRFDFDLFMDACGVKQ